MKYISFMIAALCISMSVSAQSINIDAAYLSNKGARMQEREVRNQANIRSMDSIVLSHGFRFLPETIQQLPTGPQNNIYNTEYTLTVKPTYIDIDLPFILGLTPPYRMGTLNGIMPEVQGYTTTQTSNGWTITFTTDVFTDVTYTFSLDIYSVTREGVLTISSDQYQTVTYSGSVVALF